MDFNSDTLLLIVQAIIPVLGPRIVEAVKQWFETLDGPAAAWANLALNLLGQLVAALAAGADPALAASYGVAGAVVGSNAYKIGKRRGKEV